MKIEKKIIKEFRTIINNDCNKLKERGWKESLPWVFNNEKYAGFLVDWAPGKRIRVTSSNSMVVENYEQI